MKIAITSLILIFAQVSLAKEFTFQEKRFNLIQLRDQAFVVPYEMQSTLKRGSREIYQERPLPFCKIVDDILEEYSESIQACKQDPKNYSCRSLTRVLSNIANQRIKMDINDAPQFWYFSEQAENNNVYVNEIAQYVHHKFQIPRKNITVENIRNFAGNTYMTDIIQVSLSQDSRVRRVQEIMGYKAENLVSIHDQYDLLKTENRLMSCDMIEGKASVKAKVLDEYFYKFTPMDKLVKETNTLHTILGKQNISIDLDILTQAALWGAHLKQTLDDRQIVSKELGFVSAFEKLFFQDQGNLKLIELTYGETASEKLFPEEDYFEAFELLINSKLSER